MARGRRSKKKSHNIDLQVVSLIIISILLGILIYATYGYRKNREAEALLEIEIGNE